MHRDNKDGFLAQESKHYLKSVGESLKKIYDVEALKDLSEFEDLISQFDDTGTLDITNNRLSKLL